MKILKRILLGILLLIVLAAIFIIVYLQTLKPTLSGEIKLDGLKSEVEVLFDAYGIPHIYAQHEEDAYFALGYVHAQDRLFQMEMLRRAAGGRLAEVLGPDLVKIDKLFRTLGLNQFARENAAKFLGSDTASFQRAAIAYQKGVNQFVKTGTTPIEFTIIGIPKQEFTPEDIYLAIGFMSFGFAEGLQADPVLQKIKTEYGEEYLIDLAVHSPSDAERIPSYAGEIKNVSNDALITSIREALNALPIPMWQGSNGWVVSPEKSVSGYPILANDTHIGFAQPAVWYEAHIEYPGYSFYGHHLAGIPFGLLGNNRFCGFGLTMFENDDTDFFLETPNPTDSNQVGFKGAWETMNVRTEIIKVKGESDIHFEVKSTRHGPVIKGIIENTEEKGNPVALSWTLLIEENKALQAAYQLNHATTFQEAQQAVENFSAPGLNVMYGDVVGNIAWWAAAKLPVRPAHVNSKFYLDGSSGKDEYLGFYEFSKNPHSVNPPWGFVYSCNNQPDTVDGVSYPGYYYPKSRAGRVVELLSADQKFSVSDMSRINLDVTSRMHAETAKEMAVALSEVTKSGNANKDEISFLVKILQGWDGAHQAGQVAPAVYYNLLSQIIFLAMEDELGTDALKSLLSTSVPKNSFTALIKNASSPWWDDIATDARESRKEIFSHAAANTTSLLKKICGEKPEQWTWGNLHTLTHNHAFATVKPLDSFFNVGPFTVSGGSEVINNLDFKYDTTGYFPVQSGPALRKVTHFGDIENGMTVSPTGQSGNVMSKHYSDQAEMFAQGKSRKMLMNREEIERTAKNRLLFKIE